MDEVKPRELVTAARVADALVYAAGVAGVLAGGLLFQQGEPAFAVVAWVLTFVGGAALRLAAWAAKALAQLLQRTGRLEEDLARLAARPRDDALPDPGDAGRGRAPRPPPDPWRRLGGWH